MPWLKTDMSFPRHPKTKAIALELKIDRFMAAGLLANWFSWVREFAPTGKIGVEFTNDDLDFPPNLGNFREALEKTGWTKEGWVLDWAEYGGAEIADRARRNPAKYKEMIDFYGLFKEPEETPEIPGNSGKFRARGEKSRKEKSTAPPVPPLPPQEGQPAEEKKSLFKDLADDHILEHNQIINLFAELWEMVEKHTMKVKKYPFSTRDARSAKVFREKNEWTKKVFVDATREFFKDWGNFTWNEAGHALWAFLQNPTKYVGGSNGTAAGHDTRRDIVSREGSEVLPAGKSGGDGLGHEEGSSRSPKTGGGVGRGGRAQDRRGEKSFGDADPYAGKT